MRISTSNMFETSVGRIGDTQASLVKVQQQISSGKRLLTPADDPLGAARSIDLGQGQAMNTQYAQNRGSAKDALNLQEGALQSVTSLLQDVRDRVLEAGSGILDGASRKDIATDLRSRLQQLTSLANSRDGVGNYLFAGFQDSAAPFTSAGGAVGYNGDGGQKLLQVGASREMASNNTGDAVFMNVPASLVYSTSSTGSGSAAVSSLLVKDPTLQKPGHQYQVAFDATGANYAVYDTTADPAKAKPLATGAYASPQTVAFDGIEMVVSGAPAGSDSIDLKPVRNQSVFATMDDLIATLEAPTTTPAERDMFNYKLTAAGKNIDNAMNNVLTVRASVGSRLKELDSLDDAGSARDVQYADQLSGIQDLDYVKAISDMSQKQMMLQAAQQSFVKVSGMTLFSYL